MIDNVTNVYYHFINSIYGLQNIEEQRIKVARFDSLNDPFEIQPHKRTKNRKPYNRVFNSVNNKWGMISFSSTWEDQLLWAHYADSHRGIALAFEIESTDIIDVKYTADKLRPKVQLTDYPDQNEKLYLEIAKTKFVEWVYEKEHRLLIELRDCFKEGPLFFTPIGKSIKLKKVILGDRFDHKANKDKLLLLKKKFGFDVIAARVGWEDYKVRKCGTKTPLYS